MLTPHSLSFSRPAVCFTLAVSAVLLGSCSSTKDPVPATEITTGTRAAATTLPVDVSTTAAGGTTARAATTVPETTTAAPVKVSSPAAPTACPKADGSSPQKKKFGLAPGMCIDVAKTYTVTMETTKGTMTFVLNPKKAPITVNSFVTLTRYHYFDGISFHRIIRNFVIQGGDPEGTGAGSPGYSFKDELPDQGEYKVGSLAMANAGPNTNGSQFFIITGAQGVALPPSYALFGQLTSGEDVMKAIEQLGKADGSDGPPTEPVSMTKVTVAET